MELPVTGIKVLDLTHGMYGSMCTVLLGDMGADVIKVEPPEGEIARKGRFAGLLPFVAEGQEDSTMFIAFNRSKRSLPVDLRHPRGKEIALRIAKEADIVVENFRPNTLDRLGLGYKDTSEINPRIIYCSLSGYGQVGPWAHRLGGDHYAQALSGMVSVQGAQDGPPQMLGVAVLDQGGPFVAAFGIMAALFYRQQTGIGQRLTSSLLHTGIYFQTAEASDYLIDGKLLTKKGRGELGHFPCGVYTAKDGDVLTISGEGPQWQDLCKVLGIEHLLDDPRYDTHEKRCERREEL